MSLWTSTLAIALTITFARPASPQSVPDLRKLYDAGKYQQLIELAGGAPATDDQSRVTYLVARSQEKLARKDEAREAYQQLAALSDQDPWSNIGRPASEMLGSKEQGD